MDIDQKLTGVLSEFADTLVTDFPIQAILDHLVHRIVDVLPIDGAGVTLIAPGIDPHYVAASDDAALRFEQLQSELREGPCVLAYQSGRAVSVPDIRVDDRFPAFGPRAVEEGMRAVFTFPLLHHDHQLGALDLYRATPGDLDADEMAVAQTLANVASAYLLNAQSRADLRESWESSRRTALHDSLTGLPNRALLVERLEHAISRCRRSGKSVAVLFADLDNFKSVNDTYGHHVGDELLMAVAGRLSCVLRPGDTLARLGGDEFVVLCEDLDGVSQVETIAARIEDALTGTFVLDSADIRIGASVGIAFAGAGDEVPEQLLRDADEAMYHAKRAGGAHFELFDAREHHVGLHRTDLARDLYDALAQDEMRTMYQPILRASDGAINGFEALLRWTHPAYGTIPPDVVIPMAEDSGLVSEIGRWVLERACLDRQILRRPGEDDTLVMSVNVSAHQLMSADFVPSVAAILEDTDTDPRLVTLELTETAFVTDAERALVVLGELKELGVGLALDDFGTGYSSLSYLKRFPVDVVKIDRTFVVDLERDPTSRIIVKAVIELAHALGTSVVAEGVETAGQVAQLSRLDCDGYQGFWFARPMSVDFVERMLDDEVRHIDLGIPVSDAVV